jgi:TolA-binding protein
MGMKIFFTFSILAFSYVFALWKYGGMDKSVMSKWKSQFEYERVSLHLARQNRILEAQISNLKYEISELQSKNKFLSANLNSDGMTKKQNQVKRSIASIPKSHTEDLVNYEVYKWTPEKLLAIGEKELHHKNYEKSAQFYNELISRYPQHEIVSDRVLFGAGVASFETGKRYSWSEKYLERLVKDHPKSEFYRGAKLWLALAQYNQGENQKFIATVEEFRIKYRNTDEWKILSRYYEDISYKIKQ